MRSDEHPHVVRLGLRKSDHHEALHLSLRTETTRERVMAAKEAARDMSRMMKVGVPSAHGYRRSLSMRVAEGVLGKLAAFLLIPTMLIYPILPAYAAEDVSSPSPVAVPAPSSTDTTATTDSLGTPPADAGIIATVAGAVADLVNAILPGSSTSTDTTSTSDTGTTTAPTSSDATTTLLTDTTATDTPPILPGDGGGNASSTDATTTPPLFGDGTHASSTTTTTPFTTASSTESTASSTDETASSTEDVATTTPLADEVAGPTNDEIIAQKLAQKEDAMRISIRKEVETEFTKGCVTLDTVGYYCLKDHQSDTGGALAPSTAISGVVSEIDPASSYKQIFVTRGTLTTMITHDAWDNAFPSDDLTGSALVWQGNVNGRWQIFYADATAATGTPQAIQLTHSSESNFNPRVDGTDVVWQGWVDGNWEIFFAEHLTPENFIASTSIPKENQLLGIDHEWKVTRITQNTMHDMFPSIAGELITWQSFKDNAWNIYVYSMKTHATSQLSHSGDKSEKPRFAITWDERSPEGAARMVGYDIASGKALDLTSEARQVNDEKPYSKEPQAPISQPNQAALPVSTSTATSTTGKTDGDGTSSNDPSV